LCRFFVHLFLSYLESLSALLKLITGLSLYSFEHFVEIELSRKDYLDYFKTISSATASRDLHLGVDKNLLKKKGDKSKTKYLFI